MSYDDFKPIVDLVLDNWTALQLAVEHGMGAPGGVKGVQSMSEDLARYCVANTVEADDLTEMIEDLIDEEFETVCHDGSPKEIACLMLDYLGLLRAGKHDELRSRIAAMPKCQKWLSQPIRKPGTQQGLGNSDDDSISSSADEEELGGPNDETTSTAPSSNGQTGPEPMDEDEVEPGWTLVHHRRRK